MARNPYHNTQMQNFFKEMIEKEAKTRLKSFGRIRGKPRTQSLQFQVMKKKLEETRPSDSLLERLPPLSAERRFARVKADFNEPHGIDKVKIDSELAGPDMRPVSPLIKNSLYDGFTKEGKGRQIYLKQRNDSSPETKFRFPTCTSWDYGWRLKEDMKKGGNLKPKHGRRGIVKDTFYTRNGPLTSCSSVH